MAQAPMQAMDLTSARWLLLLAAVWGGSFFFAEIALGFAVTDGRLFARR